MVKTGTEEGGMVNISVGGCFYQAGGLEKDHRGDLWM